MAPKEEEEEESEKKRREEQIKIELNGIQFCFLNPLQLKIYRIENIEA